MVLIGVFTAMWRRGRDRGAMSVQQFSNDLLPLILLFAISVTGLFLTASTHLMRGLYYVFLSQLHAVTVIFTLLYLPFGKFFHIFQRPAQMGIDFYKRAGEEGGQASCARCGQGFASSLQIGDLKAVQSALGNSVSNGRRHPLPGCLSAMQTKESRSHARCDVADSRGGTRAPGKLLTYGKTPR